MGPSIRDGFIFFFLTKLNSLVLCYKQTRHRNIAGFYVFGMLTKYLSSQQAETKRKYCA